MREIVQGLLDEAQPPLSTGAYGDEGFFELHLSEVVAEPLEDGNWFGPWAKCLSEAWVCDASEENVPGSMVSALVEYVRKTLAFHKRDRYRLTDEEVATLWQTVLCSLILATGQGQGPVEPNLLAGILQGVEQALNSRGVYLVRRGCPEWLVLRDFDLLYPLAAFIREAPVGSPESRGVDQVGVEPGSIQARPGI